ncbi:MAG: tetratricopeptide repeat protein [Candidatus Woesearchaeota archaeon]
MALLGIVAKFEAIHGSREKHKNKFTIEVVMDGKIENGFVAGIDSLHPRKKLERIVDQLKEKYLDDILGRATDENIAQYFLYEMRTFPLSSIKVSEQDGTYVIIPREEMDIKNYPSQLQYNLGHSFLLREDPGKAKEHLDKAIELNPNFSQAYNLRGRCFKYLNDYDSALADYLKTIALDDNFGEAWRNAGNAYLYLKKFEEMIPAFDRSIDLMPNSALAFNNRGYGYFVMRQFRLALLDHEKAIQIDPNYAEAHYDKAMALKSLGKVKQAERALAKSLHLKDTGRDTYHGIKMY